MKARRELLATWPIWPLMLFLIALMVVPVAQILFISFVDGKGEPTLVHYIRLFSSATYTRVLLNTFQIAGWTTVFCILLGYPVAYTLANAGRGSRGLLMLLVLLPFWTSFLVRTFAWMILLGRNGLLNRLIADLGGSPVALIYNYTGVMIGMTHALMPIAILTMASVMESIPRDLTRAAGTLGARGGHAFLRVYLPLSMPGVAAAALTTFISAVGFFITPALLGSVRETMITQVIIESIQTTLNWGFAGAVTLLLLAATLLIYWVYDRLVGLSSFTGTTAREATARPGAVARGSAAAADVVLSIVGSVTDALSLLRDRLSGGPVQRPGGRHRWISGLVLAFLVVPSLAVIPVSFSESAFLEWPPRGFTLKWYTAFLESPLWLSAIWRSLVVGFSTALLATLLAAPAAFVIARRRFALRGATLALALTPMIMPRIIIALALFYLFARLKLVGTSFGLVLSHVVLAAPYVLVTVLAVLKTHDDRFEAAAATMGARPWQALWHVTLPLLRPAFISAFLFAFVVSFDELTVALFVTGGLSTTLPKQMWDDALLKVSPVLASVSTVVLIGVTAAVVAGEAFRRRSLAKGGGER